MESLSVIIWGGGIRTDRLFGLGETESAKKTTVLYGYQLAF
ncbi:MAG: hypothetical protein JWP06_669 [Candidatus Saccharibacteria bacterium]|nr:hypothetical protein [Candidatus Saccharibacteria bacterium]